MPKFIQPAVPKPKKIVSAAQLRVKAARLLRTRQRAKLAAMRQIPGVVVNVHVHHPDAIVRTNATSPHVS